jgi:hypothetical protein
MIDDDRVLGRRLKALIDEIPVPDRDLRSRSSASSAAERIGAGLGIVALLALALVTGRWLGELRDPDRAGSAVPPSASPRPISSIPSLAVPFQVFRGSYGSFPDPTVVVVAHPDDIPLLVGAPRPSGGGDRDLEQRLRVLDFDRQVILAVFAGPKPSSGYAVEVTEIHFALPGRIEIRTRTTVPGPGQGVLPAVMSPFVVVAVDRARMPITRGTHVIARGEDGSLLGQTVYCGRLAEGLDRSPLPGAAACISDGLSIAGAVQATALLTTVEGDPVVSGAFMTEGRTSKFVRDMRSDRFSAQDDRRIWTYFCRTPLGDPGSAGMTGRYSYGDCEGDGSSFSFP